MPQKLRTDVVPRHRCQQFDTPIPKVEFTLLVAGHKTQQADHFMGGAVLVDQRGAKRHIPSAFAMHGPCLGVADQAVAKTGCRRQSSGVQFWVTPGNQTRSALGSGASSANGENGRISAPSARHPSN